MASIDIDLLIKTASSANSLKDVKTQLKALKDAMISVGDDSKEFTKLAIAAEDLKGKVDDVNERIRAVDPDGFAALTTFAGKAAGAVSAVTGAMALFGEQSEDVQKALVKVQGALALSQGIDSVKGLGKAFKDLWAVMIANPVIAVIAGLVALAAAAYKIYQAMNETSDATKELNKQYEKQKALTAGLVGQYQRQIELLQAQGASEQDVIEIKKKLIEAQILEAETSLALHKNKIKDIEANDSIYESYLRVASSIEGWLGLTDLQQQALDEISANKAERAKEDFEAGVQDMENIKNLRNQLLVIDAEVETKQRESNINIAKERKEAEDKRLSDHAALMDKILIDEIALGDQLIAEQEAINARIEEAEKERAQRHRDYVSEKKRREQEAHDHQKKLFEEQQAREEMVIKARLDAVAGLFGSLSQLADKNAKLQKGFAVGEAIINTYKGVTAALAQPLPTPINFVNAAAVLAAGIANVKKILSTQPSASGGGGGGMSGGGSLGAFGGVSAINNAPASPNVPQPTTQLNPDGSVANQNQPLRVYVLESDITRAQNTVEVAQQAVAFR